MVWDVAVLAQKALAVTTTMAVVMAPPWPAGAVANHYHPAPRCRGLARAIESVSVAMVAHLARLAQVALATAMWAARSSRTQAVPVFLVAATTTIVARMALQWGGGWVDHREPPAPRHRGGAWLHLGIHNRRLASASYLVRVAIEMRLARLALAVWTMLHLHA